MTHLIIPYCVSNPHSLHLQKQLFFSREYRSLAKGFLSALSFIKRFLSIYAWCCHALGIQGSGSVEFVWGGRQWRILVTERCEGWTGLGERHSEEELSNLRSGRGGAEGDVMWAELGARESTGNRSAVIRFETGFAHLPEEMTHSWWNCRKSESGQQGLVVLSSERRVHCSPESPASAATFPRELYVESWLGRWQIQERDLKLFFSNIV